MKDLIKIQIDLEEKSIENFKNELKTIKAHAFHFSYLRGVIIAKEQNLEILKELLENAKEND